MNIFRVGGAVRDRLLGYPHHETDWVVVGSTPDEMIKNCLLYTSDAADE